MDELLGLSLCDAAKAIRAGKVSSVELTKAALAKARRLDPHYNAFVRIDEGSALAVAQACDDEQARGASRGALHGVPLAHKDMFYRKGQVSSCGARIRADWVAPVTAAVLERLDAAGQVQIGTLNMTEFAYGPTGQNAFLGDARNPWNRDYITGGSSAGSGVAVASRTVYAALGSDTAGSVRLPSAICGLVGMKTTYGRVSRYGAMPLSGSLDCVGPLTRTVADNALLLNLLAGQDPRDPHTTADPVPDYSAAIGKAVKGLRIGRPIGYFDQKLEPEVITVMEAVYAAYRSLGCEVVEVKMPDLDLVNAAGMLVTWGDVIALHGQWMRTRASDYTPQTRGRIEVALGVSAQDYLDAQRFRGPALLEFCDKVFARCDVLIAPVLSYPVPRLSDVDVTGGPESMRILNEITRLMRPVNYLGLPALSVPGGFTSNGLPCGFQIVGRPFAEALLFRVGAAYENESGLLKRSPDLLA